MSNNTNPTMAGGKKIVGKGYNLFFKWSWLESQVFTGGSGKAGRHVIPYLLSKGHKVLNLDLIPFPDPSADVYTLKTDLTDSGQVFNALTTHFNMSGYSDGPVPSAPDVVIHFAGKCSLHILSVNILIKVGSLCTQHARPRLRVFPSQCAQHLQRGGSSQQARS
jgi:hypothetical protein